MFKDHPVTGFTSVGYAGGQDTMRPPDKTCYEAGMRDTNCLTLAKGPLDENRRVAAYWRNLNAWPWASEISLRAKTALNGAIIRKPEMDETR